MTYIIYALSIELSKYHAESLSFGAPPPSLVGRVGRYLVEFTSL
jgi:hypothetical protein